MRSLLTLLVAALLLPFVVAADATVPSPYCTTYQPASETSGDCALDGQVSELHRTSRDRFTGFEPTMHSGPTGDLYFATTDSDGVAVGFGAGVARSLDAGASWTDVTPTLNGREMPPETNDPYVYVDPWTGRVFSFHMSPILLCSILSFSDDQGATWTTNPVGCGPTGAWDHQTMVAAPPTEGVTTLGYDDVLVQCVNAIYAAMCARSLDGGLTWQHGTPAYVNEGLVATGGDCGAQHGHLASEADGTIYLPTSECATVPVIYISRDSGLTWERHQVSDTDMPFQDPTVAVDGAGTIWVSFQDQTGALLLTHSVDDGATWTPEVRITPPGTIGTKPAMIAGDDGHIAVAFPGTDDAGSWAEIDAMTDEEQRALVWGGFVTVATDAAAPDAVFTTVEVTGADPLMRGYACTSEGRCSWQVDFIETTLTPDGQVFASFSDGCIRTCTTDPTVADDAGDVGAGVAIGFPLAELDLCADVCARFLGADALATAPGAAPTAASGLSPATVAFSAADLPASWLAEVEALRTSPQVAADRAAWASGTARR